ncbi:hypothetical protein OBP_193 [Pseudomonas phage OBP]|uniref:hypothetical protein n=1 Tax=Pseudomonas phage OBP TaxID=1124849 RepID=UPI000240D5A1|nr:hypothetical protein OBP_193 [Pseudomonas phage OBP]AEV89630.1 hypothetical protein OBP_193 [Pseudomonas phage OBP]
MAANKKSPRKKGSATRRRSVHITNVMNHAINRFYMMGDMNHDPMSFHTSEINMYLKGLDLSIALQELTKFFYAERREWILGVYHFFKVDGSIQVVPTEVIIQDALLNEVADAVEGHIKTLKESIIDVDDDHTEENYFFYGYYINFGNGLNMPAMEEDIIQAFFKVNNDLSDVKPEVCECNAEKVLRAIAGEKFSLTNSNALVSTMKEVV